MTTTLIRLFTLSISLLYMQSVTAVETTGQDAKQFYDVELIVFKNISVPKGHELNLPTPSPSKTEQTLDLSNPRNIKKNLQHGFSNLQQGELRLLDIVQQIKKSSRYELLSHTGWRQPGLDTVESVPVWIRGGKIFGHKYSSIDHQEPVLFKNQNQSSNTSPSKNLNKLRIAAKTAGELYELEGMIIITLSRYLHTQANLVLRKPASMRSMVQRSEDLTEGTDTSEGGMLLNYELNEKRRMRSKKLHYLDNPQFGMLILITPYERPEIETVVDTTSAPVTAPIDEENKASISTTTQ